QPGAYFVTIEVSGKQCILGEVMVDRIELSPFGKIVEITWQELPNHYPHIQLDVFCIMPNHVHGIIVINDADESAGAGLGIVRVGFPQRGLRKPTRTDISSAPAIRRHGLPEIIRGFKTFSARQINEYRHTPGLAFWKRNYHDHVIRDEDEWQRIVEYIDANPSCWDTDRNFTP
ncbi:MAG: transposase, partial [Anaerolineaceae bacterium]